MLDDMLDIAIDPYYPPSEEYLQTIKNTSNLFDLIYAEFPSKYNNNLPLNLRTQF